MRIVYNNAAARSTLVASTTAGSLAVINLLTDIKSQVWRSTATSATLTAQFTSPEIIGTVALPFTNLSQTATMRVQLYSDAAGTVQIFDTGVKLCSPAAPVTVQGFGNISNVYGFGGGAYAVSWFTVTSNVMFVRVTLADTSNTMGYLEASRLVLGNYWTPTYNPEFGVTLSHADMSRHFRNDAGDLMTDVGKRYRQIQINLSVLTAADRTTLTQIIRNNGLNTPMFFSLYPESADNELERDHHIYGKMSSISTVSSPYFNTYAAPFVFEEI